MERNPETFASWSASVLPSVLWEYLVTCYKHSSHQSAIRFDVIWNIKHSIWSVAVYHNYLNVFLCHSQCYFKGVRFNAASWDLQDSASQADCSPTRGHVWVDVQLPPYVTERSPKYSPSFYPPLISTFTFAPKCSLRVYSYGASRRALKPRVS